MSVGGLTRDELLVELQRRGVELNDSGRALFAHQGFTTAPVRSTMQTLEVSVAELGSPDGATSARIHEQAAAQGFVLCPLELGPHLRLQLVDQPEGFIGQPASKHRAPPGSITVASIPLADDDEAANGFYLRRIEGVPWLRGYHAGADHVWSPEDRLVFCLPQSDGAPV